MFYVEWARTVKSRKGHMLTMTGLTNILKLRDPGYSSVYLFNESDALKIKANGHSKGLSQYEVSSKFLALDIDSGIEGYRQISETLRAKGIAFESWESGGKGYHVYIPHKFISSIHLPYSHKVVAESLVAKELIDPTLYQHGRLLALPGRIHPVTKKSKVLFETFKGSVVEIPLLEAPKPQINFMFNTESNEQLLAMGLTRVSDLIVYPPEKGKRHIRIWGASKDLADAGLQYETVLDLIVQVNESWPDPKSLIELEQAVKSAFKMHTSE